MKIGIAIASLGLLASSPALAQISATQSNDANALASSLQGTGVTFTSATLTGTADAGSFTGGLAGTGIGSGVVLTTGGISCVGAVNDQSSCGFNRGGNFDSSSLQLGFVASSASLFFNYVFASEEYNFFVGSQFNDVFSLVLNGANYSNVNLATLPNGDVVSINSVNLGNNVTFYRNNNGEAGAGGLTGPSLGLPIQFDGLTTVLTASATNLVIGQNYTLSFNIFDVSDNILDSAVFVQAGSVGVVTPPSPSPEAPIPEPATWAMMILGFGVVGGAVRRRSRTQTAAVAA